MSIIRSFIGNLTPPYRDTLLENNGIVSQSWANYFGLLTQILSPLGVEKSCPLENNQAVAADIVGMSFSLKTVGQVVVDFLVQRVTTSTGATELITSGTFHLVYKPTSNNWSLVTMGTPGPSTSGITFSITAAGQVQYTSTNITGTASISKITWRARTLAAKNSQYSTLGRT